MAVNHRQREQGDTDEHDEGKAFDSISGNPGILLPGAWQRRADCGGESTLPQGCHRPSEGSTARTDSSNGDPSDGQLDRRPETIWDQADQAANVLTELRRVYSVTALHNGRRDL